MPKFVTFRTSLNGNLTNPVELGLYQIQGVPRNMTIARRLESRLWYLNLFVTFSILSTLTCMILETIITFPKSGLRFLCFQYYRRYKEFGSDFNFVK